MDGQALIFINVLFVTCLRLLTSCFEWKAVNYRIAFNYTDYEIIIIIIIISILELCFPLPRVGLFDKSLEGVLSTQNDSEGQQNPYLASFCHSQALHPMISLACQIFSVQPHSACILLQSSLCCALHVQTISSYWCGAPHLSPGCQALWEGSLS